MSQDFRLANRKRASALTHCCLCDRPFDGDAVVDHGEHVIQNGIGGGLVAWGILCKGCGANLGTSVDAPFYEAMAPLCAAFDLRRDRGAPVRVPASVTVRQAFAGNCAPIACMVERGADPVPIAPTIIKDHGAKVAYVFGASPKQVRDYVASKTVRDVEADGFEVRTDARFGDFVDGIALEFRPDCPEIARGVLKIAISYALKSDVPRATIRHLVIGDRDLLADEVQLSGVVAPYFPTGWCEALYEADRYAADDFPPNHQLALFSVGPRLFCHVDLFGVIQRYVLLSDAWTGDPIQHRYLQKCPKWYFDPADWKARRLKDLDVLALEFGVSTSGRPLEDIQTDILNRAASRPYELSASSQLEKPGEMLLTLISLPLGQLRRFETTEAILVRAGVAQAEFGSDVLTAVAEKSCVLMYLRDRDREEFRVRNERGICPDLCAAVPSAERASYQAFRVGAFASRHAQSWSIG